MALVAIIQPLLLCLALTLAPAILIIAMSALSLATSILAAVVCLGEVLTVGAVAACVLIGAGLAGVVMSFHGQPPLLSPLAAFKQAHQSPFAMIYMLGTAVIATVGSIVALKPGRLSVAGKPLDISYAKISAALLAGIFSGLAEVTAKLIFDILQSSIDGSFRDDVLANGSFWGSMVVTGLLSMAAVWAFNLSFKMAEAVLVVPLRNAANILFGSLGGLLLLGERSSAIYLMTSSFTLIGAGVSLILLCQMKGEEQDDDDEETADIIEIELKHSAGEDGGSNTALIDDESTTTTTTATAVGGPFMYRSDELAP